MLSPSVDQLLDAVQAHWRPARRLRLLRRTEGLPPWVLAAAQAEVSQLPRARYSLYRAQVERHCKSCAQLYARWFVTLVLAGLVATVMMMLALAMPITNRGLAVLLGIMALVVLPPLTIYWRLACEHIAGQALSVALGDRIAEDWG